ncbi:MAG: hypothetical protein M3383_07765 [Actinomycetota bacterium]|nr:hypothetical protein [Actinomycetota bacterium]
MSAEAAPGGRILFVTSNGTGLGHLTRSMAIARRLPASLEPFFITFSAGAPVVRGQGFPVEYVASYDRPGAGNDLSWTFRARGRLRQCVGEIDPRVVVFDGTHPYERLLPALRTTGAPLVWCRRAMWRADADTAPLHRTHLFDHVLEPGELDTAADRGPTAARRGEVTGVDPIVLLDPEDLLDRAGACRELGLDPARRNVLVQLGQGDGVQEATRRCLSHLAGVPGVQAAALSSTLRGLGATPEAVVRIDATYPIARYLAAFDASVAAAGYNVLHELVAMRVPALFVPIERQTDDQAARANAAGARGVGVAAKGPDDPALEALLDELVGAEGQARMRTALAAVAPWNGAEQAARWLDGLRSAQRPRVKGSATYGGANPHSTPQAAHRAGPSAGVRLRRAWIFVSSLPRTLARIARQVRSRPRLRLEVVALGLDPAEHDRQIIAALERSEEQAARTLVITDRLQFGRLLAAGVGIEHIPGQDSPQAALAGEPYEAFRRRRLDLIRARRPRPKRTITLGFDADPPVA